MDSEEEEGGMGWWLVAHEILLTALSESKNGLLLLDLGKAQNKMPPKNGPQKIQPRSGLKTNVQKYVTGRINIIKIIIISISL